MLNNPPQITGGRRVKKHSRRKRLNKYQSDPYLLGGVALVLFGLFLLRFVVLVKGSSEISTGENGGGDSGGVSEFVPTHEWQEILEGQSVPPGLHYRISMATGKKHAKLLTEDDEDGGDPHAAQLSAVLGEDGHAVTVSTTSETIENMTPSTPTTNIAVEGDDPGEVESSSFNADMAKNVLLGLPHPDPSLLRALSASSSLSKEERDQIVKQVWDRRQKMIEQAAKDMVAPADVVSRLLKELPTSADENSSEREVVVSTLVNLEDMLSDIDNAGNFRNMGGMLPIVRLLDSPDAKIRANAAWVLGTASKGLQHVQSDAIELGALNMLLRMVDADFADEQTCAAHQKALYAIGALLRHNAVGQRAFRQVDGPGVLLRVMRRSRSKSMDRPSVTAKVLSVLGKTAAIVGDLSEDPDVANDNSWCGPLLDTATNVSSIAGRHSSLRTLASEAHEKIFRAADRISRTGRFCAMSNTERYALRSILRTYEEWDKEDPSFAETGYSDSIKEAVESILRARESVRSSEL
eukprot:g2873.t1